MYTYMYMYVPAYVQCMYVHVRIYLQGCIQDFCQGGANLEYVKKRGGEAICSCRAATGGWGIQGGERITQGGANTPATP